MPRTHPTPETAVTARHPQPRKRPLPRGPFAQLSHTPHSGSDMRHTYSGTLTHDAAHRASSLQAAGLSSDEGFHRN
jgi:hypothetical protein